MGVASSATALGILNIGVTGTGSPLMPTVPQTLEMRLLQAAFAPAPDLVFASLLEATFGGYAPIAQDAANPNVTIDPSFGFYIVDIPEPAGGWRWIFNGSTPQTIYGWCIIDPAGPTIKYSQLFDTPIPLTVASQVVEVPYARFNVLQAYLNN